MVGGGNLEMRMNPQREDQQEEEELVMHILKRNGGGGAIVKKDGVIQIHGETVGRGRRRWKQNIHKGA